MQTEPAPAVYLRTHFFFFFTHFCLHLISIPSLSMVSSLTLSFSLLVFPPPITHFLSSLCVPSLFSCSLSPSLRTFPLFSPASCKITPYHLSVCLCMHRSLCVGPGSGECLFHWPGESARARRDERYWRRRSENKKRVDNKEEGGGLDMAMWRMFWHSNCSWPTGLRVWWRVCPCVCVRWDPFWPEDKDNQLKKRKEKLKKPGRPGSIVRYPSCFHHLFNLILPLPLL